MALFTTELILFFSHDLELLQRIQNPRIICRRRQRNHISPVLKSLHWLPVRCRIDFKVLLMCCKSLRGLAPIYLQSLLRVETDQRPPYQVILLRAPHRSKTKHGDRAFANAAPTLWNKLCLVTSRQQNP
jgi:hypothetical protein